MTDASDRSRAFAAAAVAEQYERRLEPVVFDPWARDLVAAAAVAPGDRVLDVASGTGAVARAAASAATASGSVVAVDISPAMLARSAARLAGSGAAAIEFREAPADALPLPDEAFDAVLCQQGLQFFADADAALAEMRRVLAPGGRLAVSVWEPGRRLAPFADFGEALAAVGAEPPFPGAFDPDSFGISAADLRGLLERWFGRVDVCTRSLAVTWPDAEAVATAITATPFAPVLAALSADRRAAVEADLAARFASDGLVVCEMRAVLGLAWA
jgi:SAM-dependent methyltransferase